MNHTNEDIKNDHHSKLLHMTDTINTGILYLPLPEPRLQLVKPQQSLDYKHQIEQDFSTRYHYFNQEELNTIFLNIPPNDANRYKINYQNLYQNILQSLLRNIDINEEILQIKHSIKYQTELLPILIQNHQLAKREKKILYHIITKTWRLFDEGIQNEINVQYQLEQIKNEHQDLLNRKIKQEQYQTFYVKLQEMKNDITHLKREIPQLHDCKHQLQNELHQIKTHCSHHLIHFDYLKSRILRIHTHQLNNLQLERDSLITQTELIKYNLFEQRQEYDHIVSHYRQSIHHFRLTLNELEQELKQQTDHELIHLQLSHFFPRQTIHDDTQNLILILENKIEEKKVIHKQLQNNIEHLQEKIFKSKQLLIQKEKDYHAMEQIDQQLNHNISIYREIYLQLKTERRTIERQLTIKLKQYTTDDRLNHTLIQHHDSLLARQKIEQIRINTSNEQLYPLIDENTRLKNSFEQLSHQYTKLNPKHLRELRQTILYLQEMHQNGLQEKITCEYTKTNYQNLDEQLQRKNHRISLRMNQLLIRIKQNDIDCKDNSKHIQTLENKLNEEQNLYLQWKYLLKEMKNRSESYRTKQHLLQTQIQVASNNIQHSQYRLKTFTDQFFICHNDFVDQETSLKKLREFHSVLQEQDEMSLKKLSTISLQFIHLQNQYKTSQLSLQQTNESLIKYTNVRAILGRMVVRRVNLCQLLYQQLAKFDENIPQREENILMICKYINSLKIQIHQIRNQNKKFLQRNDKFQFETLKIHIDKMLDHSHQKQRLLTKQIFQRHFSLVNPLPPKEELDYLKKKFYLLKNRFIKIIFRGIICHFVLLSIQQEFANHLKSYISKSNRENYHHLNSLRINLYQLIRQLKAKTAENNMLIDYQYYLQFIHTDMFQQLTQ